MLYLKAGELHLVHPTKFCVCNKVVSNSNTNSILAAPHSEAPITTFTPL